MFLARLCSFLIACALPCSAAVEIIAHRGASHDAPENTLAAMELAWEQGADAIELDLHLSKDGEIIVMHDPDTKRTTGVVGKIVDLTGVSWRSWMLAPGCIRASRTERIPSLQSLLQTVGPGKRVFIEIKCGPEIMPRLKEVLTRVNLPPERMVIIGFGLETMAAAKEMFPIRRSSFCTG